MKQSLRETKVLKTARSRKHLEAQHPSTEKTQPAATNTRAALFMSVSNCRNLVQTAKVCGVTNVEILDDFKIWNALEAKTLAAWWPTQRTLQVSNRLHDVDVQALRSLFPHAQEQRGHLIEQCVSPLTLSARTVLTLCIHERWR